MEKINIIFEDEADIEAPEEETFDDEGGEEAFDDSGFGDESGGGDFDEGGYDEGDDFDEDGGETFDDEIEEPSEDIVDMIGNFINSKNSHITDDGEVVNNDLNVDDLENSENVEDNIQAYLSKLTEPSNNILKYVDYNERKDSYSVDVDKFFRMKIKEYKNLNSEEKLDRVKDDLYYLVNKFMKIYSKSIAVTNIPNEVFPSIKDRFGDLFDEVHSDIEVDRYKFDDTKPDGEEEQEDNTNNDDKEDDAFLWEKYMDENLKKIEIPLNEDNYYAKSKGDLLELGFKEKEGWFVYIGTYIKIATNIDFDVVVTTNFDKLTDEEYNITEKSFTNNISDGIVLSSGLLGSTKELEKEILILKDTFDIADKVKAKLFG